MKWTLALPSGGLVSLAVTGIVGLLAAGIWLGAQLRAGHEAEVQRNRLEQQVGQLRAAVDSLRQRMLADVQDYRQAQVRLASTAEGLAHDLARIEAASAAHQRTLANLVEKHPEWGDCRIGADGVHAWNAAASSADLTPDATPSNAGTVAGTLPENVADIDRRQPAGLAGQLPGSGADVSPVSVSDGAIDTSPVDP